MILKNKSSIITAISFLIFALLFFFYFSTLSSERKKETTALNGAERNLLKDTESYKESKNEFQEYVENARAELAELRQELMSTKDELVKKEQPYKSEAENHQQSKKPDTAEVEQKLEEETRQIFTSVDNIILTEGIDAEWSSNAENALTSKLESPELSNIEIVHLECRSTLCKMNLNVTSPTSQLDTYQKLTQLMPWDGTSLVQINPNGSNALIYMSREGYDLTPPVTDNNQSDDHG